MIARFCVLDVLGDHLSQEALICTEPLSHFGIGLSIVQRSPWLICCDCMTSISLSPYPDNQIRKSHRERVWLSLDLA